MGNCFLHGNGGGAALNFEVVRCASEADLPVSAKENTFAVFTETKITSWAFSVENPYAETDEGAVWFQTNNSGKTEFNAIKKNTVQVCPVAAYQCIDGEWVKLTVKAFQNGEWVDWSLYLVTVDGLASELGSMAGYGEQGFSFAWSNNGDGIAVSGTNTSYLCYKCFFSTKTTDLTKYSTAYITTGNVSYVTKIGFSQTAGSFHTWAGTAGNPSVGLSGNVTLALDISECTGEYYLAFYADMYNCSAHIKEIKLE